MGTWSPGWRGEEIRQHIAAEVVAQHAKRTGRIAEATCGFDGGELVKEIGAQGLVLALACGCRLGEEPVAVC